MERQQAGKGTPLPLKRRFASKPRLTASPRATPDFSSQPKPVSPDQVRTFQARLEPDHTGLQWTIARLPPGLTESWTETRRLRVRGEINGVSFRTSLFPLRDGRPGYFLLINKQVQHAAGVSVGQVAEIALEPDLQDRPSVLPDELIAAFEDDPELTHWAEALSESTRRDIGKWIAGVKGPEARAHRAAQMAERLLQAMQGELATPPVLELLFARNPRARSAWDRLTAVQRRGHLLGIFYYQTPEARLRRAEKAVEEALRTLDRKSPSPAEAKKGKPAKVR